jgi:excisionase family DNA binding protein
MDSGKLYSVEEAAAFLGGISKWTVHAWLAKGKLRRTKIGSRTMVSERDLQSFIARCNPEPETTPEVDSHRTSEPNVQ